MAQGKELVDVCFEASNPCVAVKDVDGDSMSFRIVFNRASCAVVIAFPLIIERGVNDRYAFVVNGTEFHTGSILDGLKIESDTSENQDENSENDENISIDEGKLVVNFPYSKEVETGNDGFESVLSVFRGQL